MRQPQEIEDREYEQVVLRVAAVGVAKASGVVCTRVPRERGQGFATKGVAGLSGFSCALSGRAGPPPDTRGADAGWNGPRGAVC